MDAEDKLKEAVERAEERSRKSEEEVRRKAEQEELDERRFWEDEERKLGEKLEMTKEIFRWGREFSQGPLYERLVDLHEPVCYVSFWGHRRNGRAFGCVSRLRLGGTARFFTGSRTSG